MSRMRFEPVKSNPKAALWSMMGLVILLALVLVGVIVYSAWGAATLSYALTESGVEIVYGPSHVHIPREEITGVQVYERLSGGRRLFGTALPRLRQGLWSFNETGRITLYASTTDGMVVIETAGGRWGITPEVPRAFAEALETGATGQYPPRGRENPAGMVAMLLVPLFIVGLSFALIFPYFRIAGRLRYELARDGLLIHGGSRPIKIPYREITGVEVKEPQGRPWKVFGVGLPGFYWGDFSWRALGPKLQLYATSLRPLVVISRGRRTVGISPRDPEAFVAELKRRLESAGR